jgi:hypothetical protein
MSYSILEHKHRYAAWAASRASSVKGCRFSVRQGKIIIEKAGLNNFIDKPDDLPIPEKMDESHKIWRELIIKEANKMGLSFTDGVAAKLINMYFKTIFVCGGSDSNDNVKVLHPPIDSVLLKSLRDKNVGGLKKEWRKAIKTRWSKFSSDEYEEVISNIKRVLNSDNLWKIESYWRGYQ